MICLGRASVDLYGEQIGGRLEDMSSFAKYVGGCPTNIAIGTARLGLKSALVTRVGDEHMGRFIRDTLVAEGVEASHVATDPERLTALVVLGIRDRDTFPLIFYRENCADMAISPDDFDAGFIASARALLVTGTHFSTPGTDAASRAAIGHARAAGGRVALDIDYRPVLWGLTGHGMGEERFVASDAVTAHLQSIVPLCDLVVGTEEEIHIAGGSADTLEAVSRLRELTDAVIVVKRGPMGCVVLPGAIPPRLEDGVAVPGVRVEVFNVLGAGDGFMSGFLRGWLRDEPLERCAEIANACGALVVSRHGCAPAMPTWDEISDYLSRARELTRLDLDARLNHMHRVTTRTGAWPQVCALAFDHRPQFEALAGRHGADGAAIARFKAIIADGARRAVAANGVEGAGVIVDDRFGRDVLAAMTGIGWWVARPIERPGEVPLAFEGGANVGLTLRAWPREHVVKCLVAYHPDDDADLRAAQEDRLFELFSACAGTGHELLVEIVPPGGRPADATTLARAMGAFYDRGVFPDWWKLPPPPDGETWANINEVVGSRDPYCRGVLLLGMNAPEDELERGFAAAAGEPLCKGFAVGRSIFTDAAEAWFSGGADDEEATSMIAERYRRVVALWQARHAA